MLKVASKPQSERHNAKNANYEDGAERSDRWCTPPQLGCAIEGAEAPSCLHFATEEYSLYFERVKCRQEGCIGARIPPSIVARCTREAYGSITSTAEQPGVTSRVKRYVLYGAPKPGWTLVAVPGTGQAWHRSGSVCVKRSVV